MTSLHDHRSFFSRLITSSAGLTAADASIASAFASVPREQFVGPGPWKIFTAAGLIETPSSDPAYLYQDVVVALAPERHINNGQPVLHALSLAALKIQEGETIIHVGAGTGYYTAILSLLTGPSGSVISYEIESDLAARAAANLVSYPNVSVVPRSATEGSLPACDIIYVNAGATGPLDSWMDALRPGGRLLFPLTSDDPSGAPGPGAMLLLAKAAPDRFHARFLCQAVFIPCAGARDEASSARLLQAFKATDFRDVRSLRRFSPPDSSCWLAGPNWWLSTTPLS